MWDRFVVSHVRDNLEHMIISEILVMYKKTNAESNYIPNKFGSYSVHFGSDISMPLSSHPTWEIQYFARKIPRVLQSRLWMIVDYYSHQFTTGPYVWSSVPDLPSLHAPSSPIKNSTRLKYGNQLFTAKKALWMLIRKVPITCIPKDNITSARITIGSLTSKLALWLIKRIR